MNSAPHLKDERRINPRIHKRLAIKVKSGLFGVSAHTENLSSSGIYCQVKKNFAPLTKIKIVMVLPLRLKSNKIHNKKIGCEGVVVRSQRSRTDKDKFEIAVFFNKIKDADTEAIKHYINDHAHSWEAYKYPSHPN